MKPEQFIREFGLGKAREVVEGAPDWASHFNEALGYTESNDEYRGGFVKFKNAKGEFDLSSKHELGVDLYDLKRLVESLELLERFGGLDGAKSYVPDGYKSDLLKQAIRDHESIYGGGDE